MTRSPIVHVGPTREHHPLPPPFSTTSGKFAGAPSHKHPAGSTLYPFLFFKIKKVDSCSLFGGSRSPRADPKRLTGPSSTGTSSNPTGSAGYGKLVFVTLRPEGAVDWKSLFGEGRGGGGGQARGGFESGQKNTMKRQDVRHGSEARGAIFACICLFFPLPIPTAAGRSLSLETTLLFALSCSFDRLVEGKAEMLFVPSIVGCMGRWKFDEERPVRKLAADGTSAGDEVKPAAARQLFRYRRLLLRPIIYPTALERIHTTPLAPLSRGARMEKVALGLAGVATP